MASPGQVSKCFRPEFWDWRDSPVTQSYPPSRPQGTLYITCTAHAPHSWWSSSHWGNHFCLFKLASFISHWFLQPYGSLNAFIKRNTHKPSHFESLDSHCTWVVLKCPVLIFNQLHMHNIPTLHVFTVVGIEPRALHKLDRCSIAESDLATQSC